MNENDDDDVDWGEPERRAKTFDHIAGVMERVRNIQFTPVFLNRRAAGTKFDVQTFSEGHDPMDFTLLDPATGRVLVTDNFYFTEPTECILVGTEDDLDGGGVMLPGVIKRNAKLVFEVAGQRLRETGPDLRVMRLTFHFPGTEPFSPWAE